MKGSEVSCLFQVTLRIPNKAKFSGYVWLTLTDPDKDSPKIIFLSSYKKFFDHQFFRNASHIIRVGIMGPTGVHSALGKSNWMRRACIEMERNRQKNDLLLRQRGNEVGKKEKEIRIGNGLWWLFLGTMVSSPLGHKVFY